MKKGNNKVFETQPKGINTPDQIPSTSSGSRDRGQASVFYKLKIKTIHLVFIFSIIFLFLTNLSFAEFVEKIYFASGEYGTSDIFSINPDGSGKTRITTNNAQELYPIISPDGKKIAFISDKTGNFEQYIMDVSGVNIRQLTINNNPYDGYASWYPDSKWLMYGYGWVAGSSELYKVNIEGTTNVPVTSYGQNTFHPDISKDGNKIVFAQQPGSWAPNNEIYTANIDGTGILKLTLNSYSDYFPSWAPDGNKIVFSASDNGAGYGNPYNIWIMNSDGSGKKKLTTDTGDWANSSPRFSPNGDKIIFYRGGGSTKVYILTMETNGLNRVIILSNSFWNRDPYWGKIYIDTYPPNPVANLKAQPGDGVVNLTWSNPTNSDFSNVKILRKTGGWSTNENDGTVVYNNNGTSHADNTVVNGTTYFYSAYAYDTANNYASATQTSINRGYAQPQAENGELTLDSDTVGLWHFNGDALDESINTNHGTAVAVITNGCFNQGYYFNGPDQNSGYIDIVKPFNANISEFSFEIWINSTGDIPYGSGQIFQISDTVDAIAMYQYTNPEHKWASFIYNCNSGSSTYGIINNNTHQYNKWYYLCSTFDNGLFRLYVNGSLVKETNTLNASIDWSLIANSQFRIANHPNTGVVNDQYFVGFMDEFRISSVARSSQEIAQYWSMASNHVDWGSGTTSTNITNGLVAYYSFDVDARDDKTNFDGILNGGPILTTGKIGNCYNFDGVDDYIALPQFGISGDKTFAGWCYIDPLATGNSVIGTILGQGVDISHRWHIAPLTNTIAIYIMDSTDNNPYNGFTNLNMGKWYHICVVSSATFDVNKKIKLYLDGRLLDEISSKTIPEFASGYNIQRYLGPPYWYSKGKVDEIGAWNRALSPSEVSNLYNNGKGRNPITGAEGSADSTPPDPVANFNAQSGDGVVNLTWSNPTNSDFSGVKVLRKTGGWSTNENDGTVVYNSGGTSFVDGNAANGTTYYYSVYAYDAANNYTLADQTSINRGYVQPQASYSEMRLDSDTVALWHFNGDANDSSPNGNHGTVNGAVLTNGCFGQGYWFNGTNDYIDSGVHINIPNTGSFTFELWFSTSDITIVQCPMGSDTGAPDTIKTKTYFQMYSTNTIDFDFRDYDDGMYKAIASNVNYRNGTWHYLVSVYDGSDNKGKIYFDGSEVGSINTSFNTKLSNLRPIQIGCKIDAGDIRNQFFHGLIDEIRISSVARSSQEIAYYYNNVGYIPPPTQEPAKYEEPKVEIPDDFKAPGQEKKFDIGINLNKGGLVTIEVYDIQGNLVHTICRDKQYDKGYHNIKWEVEQALGSGVYWVVMKGEGWSKRKRVAIIK